jgi:hypothetical protein
MVQSDGIVIRAAVPEDVQACNAFHNAFYKSDRTECAWNWEFNSWSPSVGSGCYIVAEADGKIVGTQAAMPIPLVAMGQIVPSAKSEDTLVHVRFWGKAVFARMIDVLNTSLASNKIAALWGFTRASDSFRSIGFDVPVRTSQIVRCLRPDAAAVLKKGARPESSWRRALEVLASYGAACWGNLAASFAPSTFRGLETRHLDAAPEQVDKLSISFSKRWQAITIHRSKGYLNWRLFENPYVRAEVIGAFLGGQLIGYVAFAQPEPRLAMVVDLIVASEYMTDHEAEKVVSSLLAEVERSAGRCGASAIRAWAVTQHPFDLLVRRVAKRRGWLFFRRGGDMAVRVNEDYISAFGPLVIDNWYVTRIFTEGKLG